MGNGTKLGRKEGPSHGVVDACRPHPDALALGSTLTAGHSGTNAKRAKTKGGVLFFLFLLCWYFSSLCVTRDLGQHFYFGTFQLDVGFLEMFSRPTGPSWL